MLMKVSVAVTLAAMIFIAAPYSGACFNPAVAVGLRVLCVNQAPTNAKCYEYTWVYIIATFSGGAIAGILANLHRVVFRSFTGIGDVKEVVEHGIIHEVKEDLKEALMPNNSLN